MNRDFKGRSVLSKPLNPASPTTPRGGAFMVLAVVPVDGNGNPINFGGGGGGGTDWTQAVVRTYTQGTPTDTWYVNHGMGCRPWVQIIDTDGNEGTPDVEWPDDNNLIILLAQPKAGIAYLHRYQAAVLQDAAGDTLTPDLSYADPEVLRIYTGDVLVYPNDGLGANDGDIGAEDESPTS